MKNIKFLIPAIAILIIVSLYGCNLTATSTKMVTPEIRVMGLPDPSIVESVTLKIYGPDMDTVEVSYSIVPSIINMAIPEGDDVTFKLTVGMSAAYTGTVASYKGSATADISSDGTVVTLNMSIGKTRIVIPDANNNRIVQINDMSGDGWLAKTGTDLGFPVVSNFKPYDVDFDQYGNIYIANNNSGIYGGIYYLSSLTNTMPIKILWNLTNSGMKAVSVDKRNNRVYGIYSNGGTEYVIYNSLLGNPAYGSAFVDFNDGLTIINGITVDGDGDVYICGGFNSDGWIKKYDSSGTLIITSPSFGTGNSVSDITILNDELYATIRYGTKVEIEKFNPDTLEHSAVPFSYGAYSASPSAPGEFGSLYNFLATMNDKLTVIDNLYDSGVARLISIEDILGTGWKTYGTLGTNAGQFEFFDSGI